MFVTGCPWPRNAFSRSSTSSNAFSRSAGSHVSSRLWSNNTGRSVRRLLSGRGLSFSSSTSRAANCVLVRAMGSFLSRHRAKHSSLKAGKKFHIKPVEGCKNQGVGDFSIPNQVGDLFQRSHQHLNVFLLVLFLLLHTGGTLGHKGVTSV